MVNLTILLQEIHFLILENLTITELFRIRQTGKFYKKLVSDLYEKEFKRQFPEHYSFIKKNNLTNIDFASEYVKEHCRVYKDLPQRMALLFFYGKRNDWKRMLTLLEKNPDLLRGIFRSFDSDNRSLFFWLHEFKYNELQKKIHGYLCARFPVSGRIANKPLFATVCSQVDYLPSFDIDELKAGLVIAAEHGQLGFLKEVHSALKNKNFNFKENNALFDATFTSAIASANKNLIIWMVSEKFIFEIKNQHFEQAKNLHFLNWLLNEALIKMPEEVRIKVMKKIKTLEQLSRAAETNQNGENKPSSPPSPISKL